jgi:hypothetical protein
MCRNLRLIGIEALYAGHTVEIERVDQQIDSANAGQKSRN